MKYGVPGIEFIDPESEHDRIVVFNDRMRDTMSKKPRVEITYCSQCRFILRAGWMAQELLMTFDTDSL